MWHPQYSSLLSFSLFCRGNSNTTSSFVLQETPEGITHTEKENLNKYIFNFSVWFIYAYTDYGCIGRDSSVIIVLLITYVTCKTRVRIGGRAYILITAIVPRLNLGPHPIISPTHSRYVVSVNKAPESRSFSHPSGIKIKHT
jgi:hypothetical protein